jgi:hypothetical protein
MPYPGPQRLRFPWQTPIIHDSGQTVSPRSGWSAMGWRSFPYFEALDGEPKQTLWRIT